MKIREMKILNFRGIRELEWVPQGSFVCLVGPGDSTKSTILNAVDLVLCPYWNVTFNDADFYDCDSSQPIEIKATVGELPEELLKDSKFGTDIRGWTQSSEIRDEPEDEDEIVLTIRLSVDDSLEPVWMVVNNRNPEGKPIYGKDRARLGASQVKSYVDTQLSWGKGSLLSRLTGKSSDVDDVLAEAMREARHAIDTINLPALEKTAKEVEKSGVDSGVSSNSDLRPGLDVRKANLGSSVVALHDGKVPIRQSGLGTRRLLSFTIQKKLRDEGGITLVDEIEHALEPHRLRSLLRLLRTSTEQSDGGKHGHLSGQTIITTHSPTAIRELKANELNIVLTSEGRTEIVSVDSELQDVVRRTSEALLGRKIIVCEGPTEIGIIRALDDYWSRSNLPPFGCMGVVPVDGGGCPRAANVALKLVRLGFSVALFGDSDRPYKPTPGELRQAGVEVVLWEDEVSTEERVCRDLSWSGVLDIVAFGIKEKGVESVRDAVASRVEMPANDLGTEPKYWTIVEGEKLRSAIANVANRQKLV